MAKNILKKICFVYDMGMKLFHGSSQIVSRPVFGQGNPSNDYGLGFYCTDERSMAELWASRGEMPGYVSMYEIDLGKLHVLRLDEQGEEAILSWIALLVSHRFSKDDAERFKQRISLLVDRYAPKMDGVDLIVGYRADDAYFSYAKAFLANELSLENLAKAMKLGNLGLQYALKSKKAFQEIRFLGYQEAKPSKEYARMRARVIGEYHRLLEEENDSNTFIRDILRRKP